MAVCLGPVQCCLHGELESARICAAEFESITSNIGHLKVRKVESLCYSTEIGLCYRKLILDRLFSKETFIILSAANRCPL